MDLAKADEQSHYWQYVLENEDGSETLRIRGEKLRLLIKSLLLRKPIKRVSEIADCSVNTAYNFARRFEPFIGKLRFAPTAPPPLPELPSDGNDLPLLVDRRWFLQLDEPCENHASHYERLPQSLILSPDQALMQKEEQESEEVIWDQKWHKFKHQGARWLADEN